MKLVDLDRLKWPDIAIFDMNLHGECVPMVRLSDLQALRPLKDVVPVVRCRDCQYWRQEVSPTEHWVCMQHSYDKRKMHVPPDFYCADGKVQK